MVVLDAMGTGSPYRELAIEAARSFGTDVACVLVPDNSRLPEAAIPAVRGANLMIDLMFNHDPLIYQFGRTEGLRTLVVLEPPEILERLMPLADDKRRVQAAQACIGKAKRMRVTSPAGTDFSGLLGQFDINCQYGFADDPGHWDQWPGSFILTYMNEGTAEGTLVIDAGDMVFPYKEYVRTPIKLRIERGFISAIEGGLDAAYMRSVLDSQRDPEVFAVSHVGWGLTRNARWDALGHYDKKGTEGQDGRGFCGNFLFSTGPNVSGGGTRATPLHLDVPMRNCSVYLDDQPMVLNGGVIPAEQRAA
ncbi:MAG: 2,5-dihydroxypyridine 5,6-dioxygenase [Betaproteobacteria bacterium]|nr:2,5-dihydroxypyridine 5,6-dioxygenase [Betaproteobacteria bacterium]